MKRFLGWLLAGMAVGTAVRALVRPVQDASTGTQQTAGLVAVTSPRESAGAPAPVDEPDATTSMRPAVAVALAVKDRLKGHATSMMAGSLAYYAMLAVFPALIATVSIYGLVQDPTDVQRQIDELTDVLPSSASSIIGEQLNEIVATPSAGLGIGAAVAIIGALWAASGGTKSLMAGINRAYDRTESRKFLELRLLALVLTLGIISFVAVALSLATFLPALLEDVGFGRAGRIAVEWVRWPGIFLLVIGGLGVFYKVAPNRPMREQRLISAGAVFAAAAWVVATVGFSIYAGNLANFNETYGALTGVIVLLLWFYLSGLIVLVGAEINAELEVRSLARSA